MPKEKLFFEQVFNQYYTSLRYFAGNIIKNTQEAEDIVIDTFRKFSEHEGLFESPQNIKAFLYITTRNACFNSRKSNQRKERNEREFTDSRSHQMEADAEQQRIKAETISILHREINNLPEKCRQVLVLTFFEGLKANDIAQQLNISVNTVRNHKAKALELLRLVLKEDDFYYLLVLIMSVCNKTNNIYN